MTEKKLVGILGGTFDPVHHGHLRLALEINDELNLDHVRLIPLKQPAHRASPIASEQQRLRMLELAINGTNGLVIDQRELKRTTVSYSVDTLRSLSNEFGDNNFCLILGRDAFAGFDRWKDWQTILELCHIVVATRPGYKTNDYNDAVDQILQQHGTTHIDELSKQNSGLIVQLQIPMLDISSTNIRERIKSDNSCRYLLPNPVIQYIQQERLYA